MEFKRIFSNKKVVCIIAILLASTIFLFLYNNDRTEKDTYIKMQSQHVDSYGEYVDSILEQGKNLLEVSIFQDTDSYSYKNLKKTYDEYNNIKDITLQKGDYQSIENVLKANVVGVVCSLFAVVVVWYFFEDEKKGLNTVIYSTYKGRYHIAIYRIGTLFISSALFVVLLYILVFFSSIFVYGKPDNMLVPIQSIPSYKNYTLNITVIEYCGLYLGLQIIKTVVFGMFVWMIMIIFKNRIISVGLLLIIFIIEGVLYYKVPEQNMISPLKFINLFQLIQTSEMFYKYKNINIGGIPFNLLKTILCFEGCLMVISSLVCVFVTQFKKPIEATGKVGQGVAKVVGNFQKKIHCLLSNMTLFGMEIYKVLINQKGFVILIIWIILLFSQMDTTNVFLMGNKSAMKEIYEEYSGVDDGRLRAYFQSNIDDLNSIQIQKIEEQLQYIDKVEYEQNIDVWFIDQKPYDVMWSENGLYIDSDYKKQETYGLFVITALILILGSIFSYDEFCGMKNVIHTTMRGREKLFDMKTGIILLFTFFVCFIVYGVELVEVNKIYPLTCLSAPVQSVVCMEKFPFKISILEFMIILEIVHYLCAVAICFISLTIKEIIGSTKGMIVSIILLLLPGILKILGFGWCQYISVIQPLIFVESYIENGLQYCIIQVIALVIVSVLSYIFLRKKWCRSGFVNGIKFSKFIS